MPTQDLLTISQPWNLENDIKNLQPQEKPAVTSPLPSGTPQQDVAPVPLSKDVMQDIFGSVNKKVSKQENPYASKFQDAKLSERYDGRNVYYGDYKLDPKLVDARYSKNQSWGEQSLNSLKIGLANGGAMFASGMIALPDLIYNITAGNGLDSAAQKGLFDFTQSVQDNNITFNSQEDNETDAWSTIKNVLLPSALSGSSKGWGAIFENGMFGVGALAGAAASGYLGGLVASGIGNSARMSTLVARTLNNVDKIRQYGTLAERIIDTSTSLARAARTLNTGNKLTDAAKWGYRATIGAYGEAAFEGEEASHSLKTTLTEKFKQQNGYSPTGDDLKNINDLASEGKSLRFWSNMALLMGSNTYQFKRLFKTFDLAKETVDNVAKQGLKIELNELGEAVTKKGFELGGWWNKGFQKNFKGTIEKLGSSSKSEFLKESLSEGGEEFTQTWIDKAVNSYVDWKLDHRGQATIDQAIKSITEGFDQTWDTEGLRAFLSGSISGVAQQGVFSGVGMAYNAVVNPEMLKLGEKREQALKDTLGAYKNFDVKDFVRSSNVDSVRGTTTSKTESLNAQGVLDEVAEIATEQGDKKIYKDVEALSFFDLAEPYISKGHAQILKDQFAFSLEGMSDEKVQEMFDNKNISKDVAINNFNSRVDEMNKSYSTVQSAFRNPFNRNENAYYEFETKFIPQLAYLDYRTKDLTKRRNEIESTLGDYYSEFKYFADASSIGKGRKYVQEEIDRLKETKEYLKALGNDNLIDEEFNKSKYVADTYESSLKLLDEYEKNPTQENYEKFLNEYHEAFVSKLERDDRGFFNKNEVMSKLTDFNRITGDLQAVDQLLKSYLSPNGHEVFLASYISNAQREARKRELYSLNKKLVAMKPVLMEKFPELTEKQIEDVLVDSANEKQAEEKAKKVDEQTKKDNAKIQAIKDQIRQKFITEGRGDLVEEYLNGIIILPTNGPASLKSAEEYIRSLNNKEFRDFKEQKHKEFLDTIQKLNPTFAFTGLLEEDDNKLAYDALDRKNKVKYHEALIKYYKELSGYKGLPKTFVQKQNELIKEQEKLIKGLPEEQDVYSEQMGDYLIVKDGGKYNLSYKGKYLNSYDSLGDAKKAIQDELNEALRQRDVKSDNINNLDNKFENGYYDPKTFDENGNRLISKEQALKNRSLKGPLYNAIAVNRNEQEISDDIKEHLVIEKFDAPEKQPATVGKLTEKILRPVTTDAIVIKYDHEELGHVPLNTYKNYKNGLAFVSPEELRKVLSEKVSEDYLKIGNKFNWYGSEEAGGELVEEVTLHEIVEPLKTDGDKKVRFKRKDGSIITKNINDLNSDNKNKSGASYRPVSTPTSIDNIISFIGDNNYYQFLQKSLIDPSVYNFLVANKFLQFKGTIQDQINLIDEKSKVYDKLNTSTLEEIKRDMVFEREFTAINYNNQVTTDINNVVYPFALLKESNGVPYNKYVFFNVKNNFKPGEPYEIDFIGLESKFHKEATEKLQQSFQSKFEDDGIEVFKGYYMLTTDSSGSPAVHKLKSRSITGDQFMVLTDGGKNLGEVVLLTDDPDIDISFSQLEDKTMINIGDKKDESVLSFEYDLSTEKSVDKLVSRIYKELSKSQNWLNVKDKKSLRTDKLSVTLNRKTNGLATTAEEILTTRQVTVDPLNYKVNKIVPRFKEAVKTTVSVKTPKPKPTPKPTPVPVQTTIAGVSQGAAKSLGLNIPNTITYSQIDEMIGKFSNLQSTPQQLALALVMGSYIRSQQEKVPVYLNDIENMDTALLDKMAKAGVGAINQAFVRGNVANLFVTKIPYKTNLRQESVDTRVQQLIKNCFK